MKDTYPLDVSVLTKGQLLTPGELEQITGKKTTDENWAFLILSLREFIHEHTDYTVKITTDGLRILTDSEAAVYNHRRFHGHLNGAARRFERNALVDALALSPGEAAAHNHDLINESRYISALSQTTKRIGVQEHRRALPGPSQPQENPKEKPE